MHTRINNPAMLFPETMQAMLALSATEKKGGVAPATLTMVHLRASQINGCAYCVDMHSRELKQAGQSDERIWAVGGWHDSTLFTDAERAALALTEAGTRLSDRSDAVPDEIWNEAARHYDEKALGSLVIAIAAINAWNRFNVITRQPQAAGDR